MSYETRHIDLSVVLQGLGKRVPIVSFRKQGRVGMGRIAVRLSPGDSVAASVVVGDSGTALEHDDVMISSTNGMLVRVALKLINVSSRTAKGHRVVKLKDGDEVGTVTVIHTKVDEDN